jgi:PLP dependent protein
VSIQDISENLRLVRERIAKAALRSGRQPEEITLVAVTKRFGPEYVSAAIAAGVTDIGENYVQEASDKWSVIGSGSVRWHLIGHLQRNKAKNAVQIFDMVQSVDSVPLAEELGRRAVAAGKALDVLIEVNVAEEDAKFGVTAQAALEFASQVSQVEGIKLMGLMGMAPFVDDAEEARPYFASLKKIWDRLPLEQRRYLSMGMTHDFEVAIEEGANMVRIGTAIFGSRV